MLYCITKPGDLFSEPRNYYCMATTSVSLLQKFDCKHADEAVTSDRRAYTIL
jgi:hypothetical protein